MTRIKNTQYIYGKTLTAALRTQKILTNIDIDIHLIDLFTKFHPIQDSSEIQISYYCRNCNDE